MLRTDVRANLVKGLLIIVRNFHRTSIGLSIYFLRPLVEPFLKCNILQNPVRAVVEDSLFLVITLRDIIHNAMDS